MSAERLPAAKSIARLFPVLWPSLIALTAVIAGFMLLPSDLRAGPGLLLPVSIAVLTVILALLYLGERHRAAAWVGKGVMALTTVAVAFSAALLVYQIPERTLAPRALLLDAGLIWALNGDLAGGRRRTAGAGNRHDLSAS